MSRFLKPEKCYEKLDKNDSGGFWGRNRMPAFRHINRPVHAEINSLVVRDVAVKSTGRISDKRLAEIKHELAPDKWPFTNIQVQELLQGMVRERRQLHRWEKSAKDDIESW
jgi:hypothetical protein